MEWSEIEHSFQTALENASRLSHFIIPDRRSAVYHARLVRHTPAKGTTNRQIRRTH